MPALGTRLVDAARRGGSARARAIGAALAVAIAVSAVPNARAQGVPDKAAVDQAQERFIAGQKLYNEQKYADALTEFRASYETVPSPNSRLYMARCLREIGRVGAAYEEYALVVKEATEKGAKYAPTGKAAAAEQEALKDKIATIQIVMPADAGGASLRVGPENVASDRWSQPIIVEAGTVPVRAGASGRKSFEEIVTVAPGETKTVTVDLPSAVTTEKPPEPDDRGPSTFPYKPLAFVSAGVGVVGLALWGIFGLKASSRHSDLEDKCEGRCDPDFQDSVDAGRTETTISNVGLVIGVLGVAGGVTLWIVGSSKENKAEVAQPKAALRLSPNPRAPAVTLGGTF